MDMAEIGTVRLTSARRRWMITDMRARSSDLAAALERLGRKIRMIWYETRRRHVVPKLQGTRITDEEDYLLIGL